MRFPRRLAAVLLLAAHGHCLASGFAELPDPAAVLAGLKASRPAAFAPATRPLLLADHADRAAVDALWTRLQASALGRELSAVFAARGLPVRVVFEEMGTTVDGDGLDGARGWSEFESDVFVVHLSALLREPRWLDEGASTLAHEALGHCDRYQALPPGLSTSTYHLYAGDETYASLVGWVVALELDARASVEGALAMAEGRSAREAERRFVNLAYAQALSLEEMGSPAEVYAARREEAGRRRAANAGLAAFTEFLSEAAEHFVSVHGEDPARFAFLRASVARRRAAIAAADGRLADAESWLTRLAAAHAAGGPEAADLRAAASHPFLADVERRIASLSLRVRTLTPRAAPSVSTAPAGAPSVEVDESKLLSLMKGDLAAHREFWGPVLSRLPP